MRGGRQAAAVKLRRGWETERDRGESVAEILRRSEERGRELREKRQRKRERGDGDNEKERARDRERERGYSERIYISFKAEGAERGREREREHNIKI